MKICLVGDAAVGKTSLIRQYVHQTFTEKYLQTMGTQVTKKEIGIAHPLTGDQVHIDMVLWDIIGQKDFRKLLQEAYFQGAKGILGVCDLTREYTLEGLGDWAQNVRNIAGNVPLLTLGNKNDLQDDIRIGEGDITEFAGGRNASYFLTSAKTGENVEDAFTIIAEEVLKANPFEKLAVVEQARP